MSLVTRFTRPFACAAMMVVAIALASTDALATHLRGVTITWAPTGNPGEVTFNIQYAQRWTYPNSPGVCSGGSPAACPALHSPFSIGGSSIIPGFNFGDGTALGTATGTVTAINEAEDWFIADLSVTHTYSGTGPFTASFQSGNRISTLKLGHDQQLRMETTVTPSSSNHPPVASMPAIVTVPWKSTPGFSTDFVLGASDFEGDALRYRLSTAQEMYGATSTVNSCLIGQPPGLIIDAVTGQVTWDTAAITQAGCGFSAPAHGDLWTAQFMIEDLDGSGNSKSKVPVDVILKFVAEVGHAPTLTIDPPGPLSVQVGTPVTFTVTGNDVDTNARVVLNATGIPPGATASGLNQLLPPTVTSTFNWTPAIGQGGTYVVTYTATDDTLQQALKSITINVEDKAPVLIAAIEWTTATARLLGRLEGVASAKVALEVFSAASCTGLLAGPPLTSVSVQTDPNGYFVSGEISGIAPGAFASLRRAGGTIQSNCLVSTAENDAWPGALLVTSSAPVFGYIDAPGKARWYKFSITPGQRVDVTLSSLPADYDLAIFKDIEQVFRNQLAGTPAQVTKLTAEFAPSVFSPSVFSPSVFSPSVFSPDAYTPSVFSPSVFSPSVFSPSVFSPSVFSPSVFSPSVFSPSVFSPSVFSPSVFSPSVFSPSVFSPSVFSPEDIAQAFSSAQTRSLLGVSATSGLGNEAVAANTWNNTGNFYVRVVGRAGAYSTSSPFSIQVVKGATTCNAVSPVPPMTRTQSATGLKTLVVTDSSPGKVALDDSLPGGGTLRGKLNGFLARPEIAGTLVDIAADSNVSALKSQAATHSDCPYAKNLLAQEIKAVIDSYRTPANPGLRYIVLAGNDDVIPFFRYPDETLLGQESGYVPPVSSISASEASLRRDFVLGQDAYGSTQQISLRSTEFPIPGLAVGRLVETPAEMAGLIDAYTSVNGLTMPHSALVTGYDFLQDAADAVSSELAAGMGTIPDKLITPNGKSPDDPASWTAADLRQKLGTAARYDLMFLAGHFSANSLLAADFKTSVITTELSGFPVDLTNSIVFSAGCHSGYNLVDTDAIPGITLKLDWAQAFAQKKATLIAGTGYQYGDTDFLEYSERIYNNFAKQLRAGTGPVSVGEALVKAKQDYLASTPDIRGLHQKVLLEATLFGLPMLAANMPAGRTPAPSTAGVISTTGFNSGTPAYALGLQTANLSVTPALSWQGAPSNTSCDSNPTQVGCLRKVVLTACNVAVPPAGCMVAANWLSGPDGIVTNPAEPTLPLAKINVTPTNSSLVLRGVGFRGGVYSDTNGITPLTGSPTTELRGVHTPFLSPVFFPMRLATANYYGALGGAGGTALLVTPAQHRAFDASAGTSTLRKFTSLNLQLYYSGLTTAMTGGAAALSAAPTIVNVNSVPTATGTRFTARVVGDPAAAVHEVWVTYTTPNSNSWTSVTLTQCAGTVLPGICGTTADSQYWMADVASLAPGTQYIVQAVNGVGLVALDDNLGAYYSIAATPASATAIALDSVPSTAAFGDTVPMKATLSAGASGVAGRLVSIGVGGGAASATTDGNGKASVSVPITATPGTYPVTAAFGGDAAYLPASKSATVTVTKASTALTSLGSFTGGATLTATLGSKTQPLMQETVRFNVTGPSGAKDVYAITDYLGRATLPTAGLPAGTYTVNSAQFEGNTNYAASSTISVTGTFVSPPYAFGGFLQPVYNPPVVNSVKAGSAVPLKFSLKGNRGFNIFTPSSPASQAVTCGAGAVSALDETVAAGASSLQYDSTKDQYTYVWKTDKAWLNTCRVLVLSFMDGSQYRAYFQMQ